MFAIAFLFSTNAAASIQLTEFDVTHAISSSSGIIPVIGVAPGVVSSALVPVGVSFGGVSTPGLYWDSSWTTAATPNSFSQRLFFNLFADPGVTLTFDTLEFDVNSGGSSPMGIELRVFGAGGSTIGSPQYLTVGYFNSPVNLATHVVLDMSSLIPLSNGDAYQFSLSFFDRDPTKRIGLSGDRSDIGVNGGNVFLTGETRRSSGSIAANHLDGSLWPRSWHCKSSSAAPGSGAAGNTLSDASRTYS